MSLTLIISSIFNARLSLSLKICSKKCTRNLNLFFNWEQTRWVYFIERFWFCFCCFCCFHFCFFLKGGLILKSRRQLWKRISLIVDKSWDWRERGSILTKKTAWNQVWTLFYRDETVKLTALIIKTRLFDDFFCSAAFTAQNVKIDFVRFFFSTFFNPQDFPIFRNNVRVTKMVFTWHEIKS